MTLKFRAWKAHEWSIRWKELISPGMVYFSLFDLDRNYIIPASLYLEEDTIIMRATGLLDVDKNMIYEGDILYTPSDYVINGQKNDNCGEVIWYHDCWRIRNSADIKNPIDIFKDKIIGNVYEHPKKLKK
jgi:hypothetical protein